MKIFVRTFRKDLPRYAKTAGVTAIIAPVAFAAYLAWEQAVNQFNWAAAILSQDAEKLESQGWLPEAEALLREAAYMQEFSLVLYPGHVDMRNHLATLLTKRNKLAEAEQQFARLLADITGSRLAVLFGARDLSYARVNSSYAECLRHSGRLAEARQILESTRPVLIGALGKTHPVVEQNAQSLRQIYRALGLSAEAAALGAPGD